MIASSQSRVRPAPAAGRSTCALLLHAVLTALLLGCILPEALHGAGSLPEAPPPATDSLAHDSTAAQHSEPSFFTRLLNDFARQATSPFSMTTGEALATAGRAVTLTGLLFADTWIDRNAREFRRENSWVDHSSPVITQLGGTAGFVGAGVFVGYSLLFGDAYDCRTSMMLGEAIITSAVWTRALKFVAGRRRPSTFEEGKYDTGSQWMGMFKMLRNPDHRPSGWFDSFPSGHTTTAFAIATVFAERYNSTPLVPVLAYSLATLVGLSRLTETAHWASDVFTGGLIGYLCAKDVVVNNGENPPHESGIPGNTGVRYGWGIAPLDDGAEVMVAVTF